MELGVVILGAGASSRMGRPKLLLPWGGASVLGHAVHVWRQLGAVQLALVHARGDEALIRDAARVGVDASGLIENPDPSRGMFISICCAGRWKGWPRGLSHVAIVLGDQPHVRRDTLRGFLEFAASQPARICQPSRGSRARHPVLLPAGVFARLAETTCENLKEFRLAAPEGIALWPSDDAGLDLDLDTPEDYERALKEFGVEEVG